jgi:hypothetical protein
LKQFWAYQRFFDDYQRPKDVEMLAQREQWLSTLKIAMSTPIPRLSNKLSCGEKVRKWTQAEKSEFVFDMEHLAIVPLTQDFGAIVVGKDP